MRSSIACIRCRRSKVKCVNTGVGTTCRNCENTGRECRYPSPILVAGQKRRDSIPPRLDGGTDEGRRQRPRKSTQSAVPPSGVRDQPRSQHDPLDGRILTPEVWQKLFEIWQMHYSIDLPFIHPLTFLRPLRAVDSGHFSASTSTSGGTVARPPGRPEFLLAFLALTARFHPALITQNYPPNPSRLSNAISASDYYATACKERLAKYTNDDDHQDVQRVQTLLMLGMHEWGMCRGLSAFLTIGNAARLAQALGLQYEADLDDRPWSCNSIHNLADDDRYDEDETLDQELRRRTFWGCFNMELHLCHTKFRTQTLQIPSIRVQLPASERAFVSGEKVRTSMIDETPDLRKSRKIRQDRLEILDNGRTHQAQRTHQQATESDDSGSNDVRVETVPEQDLLNRYIQLLDIYASVAQWGCDGGYKTDRQPPWHPDSGFVSRQKEFILFDKQLRRQNELTTQNTQAYISLKTSTPYVLVHFVRLLCRMNMDRGFLPFIPLQCSGPQVPLDPPNSYRNTEEAYKFWKGNAREYFRAARDITELARSCQEWGVLVATPLAGFAIYNAALAGVYAVNFPWMDEDGSMCTPLPPAKGEMTRSGESKGLEAARQAFQLVASLPARLQMADGWRKTLTNTHKYYRRVSAEYKNIDVATAPKEHVRLAETHNGHDISMIERTMRDFGGLHDEDLHMGDGANANTSTQDDLDDISSALDSDNKSGDEGNGDVQSHNELRHQPSNESGAWNAVNANTSSTARHGSISAPNSGGFRAYESFPHYPREEPQPASSPTLSKHRASGQPNYPHQITNLPTQTTNLPTPTSSLAPSEMTRPPPQNQNKPFEPKDSSLGWSTAPDQTTAASGISQSNGHRPSIEAPVQTQRQKQAWLDGLVTRFGADDIAAFAEGVDFGTWAGKAKAVVTADAGNAAAPGLSWLAAVWS